MSSTKNANKFKNLQNYENRLDIVNCTAFKNEIIESGIYTYNIIEDACKHIRSKYIGLCAHGKVDTIAEIKGVCEIDAEKHILVSWLNDDNSSEEDFINIVKAKTKMFTDLRPIQVFVLNNFRDGVNFEKGTPGGMFGIKKYFNFNNEIKNIDELENLIQNKTWNNFT